jgi:hypothetical protein
MTTSAEKRHRADFGECPLLEVEPPFIPDACPSLEARLSLLHIYFSNRLTGANTGLRGQRPSRRAADPTG